MTADGVALCSTAHPRTSRWRWWLWDRWRRPRLSPESLETIEIQEPAVMSDSEIEIEIEIEAEIQAKGLTAPRITVAHIEETIIAEAYITGDAIPVWLIDPKVDAAAVNATLGGLTVCVLGLKNGFTV